MKIMKPVYLLIILLGGASFICTQNNLSVKMTGSIEQKTARLEIVTKEGKADKSSKIGGFIISTSDSNGKSIFNVPNTNDTLNQDFYSMYDTLPPGSYTVLFKSILACPVGKDWDNYHFGLPDLKLTVAKK